MSDDDDESFTIDSEEAGSDDGGEVSCGGIGGACACFLIGLLLWPGSLFVTGWNEKRVVCREKAVIVAEKYGVDLLCDQHTSTASGKLITDDMLGYLSCDVNRSTFTFWTPSKISGLHGLQQPGQPLMGVGGTPAAVVKMHVQMYVCEERCIRKECKNRRLNQAVGEDKEPHVFVARQLSSRRRQKTCNKQCVEWDYDLKLVDDFGADHFHNPERASQKCGGGNHNPSSSSGVKMGISTFTAAAGKVKVNGGGWAMNDWQLQQIPCNTAMQLTDRAASSSLSSQSQPPVSLNPSTTYVVDNTIRTCTGQKLGCLVINFLQGAPKEIVMLGKMSILHPGQFAEDKDGEWEAPKDWICGSGYTINRICPMATTIDVNKGMQSCGEGLSKSELFETMKQENNTTAWVYRIGSFLCAWFAVCMICSPITAIVTWLTDKIDDITECIPCVGDIVDLLTDWVVGIVQTVVCMLSCVCAVSSFLFVASFMWMVMRPMVAVPLMVLALCCCVGTCFVARKNTKSAKQLDDPPLEEESG